MTSKVAIVILNWNGCGMMQKYLSTVIRYSTEDARIIVADNASDDDSLLMLKKKFPEVEQIVLDKNYGFAEGYNQAFKQVEAEYYILLNSDVEVTAGWLKPLTDFMDSNVDVAACQPKLLSVFNKERFEYAGAAGGYMDKLGYPFCRGRIFDDVENDNGQYDNIADILWATGACLMIRSKDYWMAGGLDGRFFAHNEEIDLCWRLAILGKRIVCIPGSKVYHVGGGTLSKSNPVKTYLNFRNNLTMLYKNLPAEKLNSVMRWRCVLDYVAAFKSLIVDSNLGEFKAICCARRDFGKWKHDFDADRCKIQAMRRKDKQICYMNINILWQYYIRGRKTFQKIKQ